MNVLAALLCTTKAASPTRILQLSARYLVVWSIEAPPKASFAISSVDVGFSWSITRCLIQKMFKKKKNDKGKVYHLTSQKPKNNNDETGKTSKYTFKKLQPLSFLTNKMFRNVANWLFLSVVSAVEWVVSGCDVITDWRCLCSHLVRIFCVCLLIFIFLMEGSTTVKSRILRGSNWRFFNFVKGGLTIRTACAFCWSWSVWDVWFLSGENWVHHWKFFCFFWTVEV